MIEIEQALALVQAAARPLAPRPMPLEEALGRVLAEEIQSDVDSPPHDKSMVDGYAIVAEDLSTGTADLEVIEQVTAGQVPALTVQAGQATQIMTGAPIPPGATAVVMVERTERTENSSRVRIADQPPRAGMNILRRGNSLKKGETVLSPGRFLRPMEIGLLAEVGKASVHCVPRPRVAILATGNELVEAGETPAAGQIRNSNGPMLAAFIEAAGGEATALGIARDHPAALKRSIEAGLACDILLLSGGVSAGVLDLAPGVLKELGVEEVFHKVRLKPGKPLWFGRHGRGNTLVFGLPGNPVSSLVCAEIFVRPALNLLAGRASHDGSRIAIGKLAAAYSQRGDRRVYWPAWYCSLDQTVSLLDWQGSADLHRLCHANSLAIFPAGEREYPSGEEVEVHLLG